MKFKHTKITALCAALLGAGFFAGGLVAQDHKGHDHGEMHDGADMDPEQMMQMYMEMGTPVEQHAKLATFAGKWDQTQKHWMQPGAPPVVSEAEATSEMIMGGRYMIDHVKSEFMGMPFEGRSITGYDRAKKQYFSVWIDNFGTGMMTTYGDYNDKGELVMEGHWSDPMSPSGKSWVKTKAKTIGANRMTFEMWMEGEENEPMKAMEIVATRAR